MTPNPNKDPAIDFCDTLFDWLKGNVALSKKELVERLNDIFHDASQSAPGRARIGLELKRRGVNTPLEYRITSAGAELKEGCLKNLIGGVEKQLARAGVDHKRNRTEEKPCVKQT